ncbi:ROK-family transcriptional regulator [Streptomyces bungoensis]|uniref:ROK-family transcriptional regulator n=1 Tax=Streptomyces bungoensis TaxID=285568 RepID=A0A117R8G0_9ACTN|nr:ROK-family transcriptional regulator [Streptomyces bungoensis]
MPASPSTARAINDRLALGLLQQEGPLTAGQLKQLTGLSRPTVADLVERLTASGLVTVVGESGEQRRGPNARLYGIVADRAHLAALDVRTGGVFVLVSDLVGRVLAEASVPIGGDTGTGPAVDLAVAAVERAVKEAGADRLHTVGIGAPGLIDPATGDLRDSGGLPAWHRRLAATLQERLPEARVTVENETNLAALAEQREGAARDRDTFVLLWLGHGVGAAVVLDGTLRRGASGGTGEIGFLPVPGTASLPSSTDCDGGFHSLAAAAAIGDLARGLGLPTAAVTDGPGAAEVVRGAVATVTAAGGTPAAGSGTGVRDAHDRPLPDGDRADAAAEAAGADDARQADAPSSVPGVRAADVAAAGPAPRSAVRGRAGAAAAAAGAAGAVGAELLVPEVHAADVRTGDPAPESATCGPIGAASAGPGGVERLAEYAVQADAPSSVPGVRAAAVPAAGPAPRSAVRGHAAAASVGPRGAERPAHAGADRAARFLEVLADRIAVGAASVVAVLDPGCVVLGGEVGQAGGPVLARMVEERLRRMSPLATEVRAGSLGGTAVLRGALLTARDRAQDDLFAPADQR